MVNHLPIDIRVPIEEDNPSIVRTEEVCKNCKICTRTCANEIGVLSRYTLEETGGKAICINCGQCTNVCPFNNIVERYEYQAVKEAIADPEKIVIVQAAPAVRAALGEEFGMEDGSYVEGKMVALLRALGADYVLDTCFSADLTIVEEASELIERVTKGTGPLPQFTSCCPAWVKYCETFYPEMIPNLSSAKSPISMQGALIKTYFAKLKGIDPEKIVTVTVGPCTAKKAEVRRPEMNAAGRYLGNEAIRDNDNVITTRELAKWAKEEGIDFVSLEDSAFDSFMSATSGAGLIFGNTGGVMEAALRTAYEYITKEASPAELLTFTPVRGLENVKEASVKIGDLEVNVAVVHGTANVPKMMEIIKSGEKQYHFIEVMTCPGGCIGGGGQPKNIRKNNVPALRDALRNARIQSLYKADEATTLRKSHENPEVQKLYAEFLGEPLSELAEEMLHTTYTDKSGSLSGK